MKEISALVERFERNREAYLSGDYNETQLRREFILTSCERRVVAFPPEPDFAEGFIFVNT